MADAYEGNVNKLLIDDKGFLAVVVFGLHPFIHEDDPSMSQYVVCHVQYAP